MVHPRVTTDTTGMGFIEGLFADPKDLVGVTGFIQMIILLVRGLHGWLVVAQWGAWVAVAVTGCGRHSPGGCHAHN